MYAIQDYDSMFADLPRTTAYLAAIERTVTTSSVVVEIGTGVGYFAVAACRAGARRVYAIELNPAIEMAPQVAADNGCTDRITFIRDDSRRVTLPEPGDVLLSDLRGVLPPYGEHIPTIVDARRRLIRPGAAIIPRGDTMWAAPCTAPAGWTRDHQAMGAAPHGIVRRSIAERIRSDWYRCHLGEGDLAAEPLQWAALDYATIESPNVSGRCEWIIGRAAAADGIAVWFDGDFGPGAALSNSPLAPRALYGQAFFPFEQSLSLHVGDRLTVELAANHAGGDYVWSWQSTLVPAGGASSGVNFRQSNLAAHVGSLDRLRELGAMRPERTPHV